MVCNFGMTRESYAMNGAGEMIYRTLGRTGEKISAIGVGGFHIGMPDEAVGIRIIRTAIDEGITFMDNCWDYHKGESEVRMGKALRDGYREKVFLMTKIDGRKKGIAAKQVDECLRRMQTDCIDLMQHHEVLRMEEGGRDFWRGRRERGAAGGERGGKDSLHRVHGHKIPRCICARWRSRGSMVFISTRCRCH
jgi:hypothetical protein